MKSFAEIVILILIFLTNNSTEIELDVIRGIEMYQKDFLQSEISIKDISKLIAVKDQLKVFEKSKIDFSIDENHKETSLPSYLKDSLHLETKYKLSVESNRGAFVIYDTNDYPYACICNSAQYQNWINSGSNSTVKVECTNKINTGIFNSNDVDYCDPTNIAASQN